MHPACAVHLPLIFVAVVAAGLFADRLSCPDFDPFCPDLFYPGLDPVYPCPVLYPDPACLYPCPDLCLDLDPDSVLAVVVRLTSYVRRPGYILHPGRQVSGEGSFYKLQYSLCTFALSSGCFPGYSRRRLFAHRNAHLLLLLQIIFQIPRSFPARTWHLPN